MSTTGYTLIATDGAITQEQAAELWKVLPEAAAVALLKAAPRVAGPWTPYSVREDNAEEREWRCAGVGMQRQILGWFSKNIDRGTRGWFRYGFGPGGAVGEVETKEAARHICDEYNRASGWLLDNEK